MTTLAVEGDPVVVVSEAVVQRAPAPRRARSRRAAHDDRPCRHACRHLDCLMDRGEPLPGWVVGYRDGERYHDAATLARAREEAIRVVDGRRGYTIEFASDPAAHALDYDQEADQILAAWDREADAARSPGAVQS